MLVLFDIWHTAGHLRRPAERALCCRRSTVCRARLACAPARARRTAFRPSWVRAKQEW